MPSFIEWLAGTGLSQSIRQTLWIIPALQSVHIIAIAAVVSSVLFVNLRLLRRADRDQTLFATADRFLPWVWFGLIVLLLTGALLVVGEPRRQLLSVPFWIKMGLIVCGVGVTLWFQRTLASQHARWDRGRRAMRVKGYAIANLVIWVGIITAGRLIAYVY